MIFEFTARRILFVPKAWLNAVARWIAGVHSPSGTIRVKNTLNPGTGGSLQLDVNMQAVVDRVKKRLGFDAESPMTRNGVRDTVFDLVDGASIINSGRRLAVGQEWLAQQLKESGSSAQAETDVSKIKDVADEAELGSSTKYAPSDHVHKLPLAIDGGLEFTDDGTLRLADDEDGIEPVEVTQTSFEGLSGYKLTFYPITIQNGKLTRGSTAYKTIDVMELQA